MTQWNQVEFNVPIVKISGHESSRCTSIELNRRNKQLTDSYRPKTCIIIFESTDYKCSNGGGKTYHSLIQRLIDNGHYVCCFKQTGNPNPDGWTGQCHVVEVEDPYTTTLNLMTIEYNMGDCTQTLTGTNYLIKMIEANPSFSYSLVKYFQDVPSEIDSSNAVDSIQGILADDPNKTICIIKKESDYVPPIVTPPITPRASGNTPRSDSPLSGASNRLFSRVLRGSRDVSRSTSPSSITIPANRMNWLPGFRSRVPSRVPSPSPAAAAATIPNSVGGTVRKRDVLNRTRRGKY